MIAPWLVYATVSGFLIALVIAIGEPIMRRRGQSLRWAWLVVLICTVALPVLLNLMPQFPEEALPNSGGARFATGAPLALPPTHSADATLMIIWGALSMLLMLRIAAGAIMLQRRRKRWVPATLHGASVLLADDVGPAVVGWKGRATVIPRWALAFDEPSRALMLQHEAEHARTGDPYLRLAGLSALILMPWNLALWWSVRRLRLAIEMDCDQRVLAAGADPHVYASLLLAVGARNSSTPFAWATALGGSPSSLEKRIVAMTRRNTPRYPRIAHALTLAAAFGVAIIACAAPVPDPILPPPASKVVTGAKPATNPWEWSADTLQYECKLGSTCADSGVHKYIEWRRRSPRDTFVVTYDGKFGTDTIEAACEINSDCHGFVAEGRRNDTLFIYRNDDKTYQLHRRAGPDDIELPTTTTSLGLALTIGPSHRAASLAPLVTADDIEVVDSIPACTAAQKAQAARPKLTSGKDVLWKKCN